MNTCQCQKCQQNGTPCQNRPDEVPEVAPKNAVPSDPMVCLDCSVGHHPAQVAAAHIAEYRSKKARN